MPNRPGIGSEPIYKEIGQRMRWLRQQKGWSLRKLGAAMGGDLHPSSLQAWENGFTRPGLAELIRVAHAFGADISVFLADITLEQCLPPPDVARQRKAKARKRIETMKQRGVTTRNKGVARKPIRQKG